MSHLQVYFRIRDKSRETGVDGPVLILEDDIIMEKFISYEIKRHLKVLPSHWDIFSLGLEVIVLKMLTKTCAEASSCGLVALM
jgi:hypothetical protein